MKKYIIEKSKKIWYSEKEELPGGCHFNFFGTKMIKNIYYENALGSRIWDVDENEYLDLYAKSGTMILGHNNTTFNKQIKEAIDGVISANDTPLTMQVISMIKKCLPSMQMVRFGLSGAETIQNALRLARAYTGKQKIIRFAGHFHGSSDNILGNLYDSNYCPYDDLTEANSTKGRAKGAFNEIIILPWNDIKVLEEQLQSCAHEVAAIIMEPVMVNNGSIMPREGYLQKVRELCDKYNILLIFDEVITGFRVGIGGAQSLLGITPDLTVAGKAISNGFVPISVLGGKRDIMQMYANEEVAYLGTYNGYPLGIAAINVTLQQLMNKHVYINMEKNANEIASIMKCTAKRFNIPFVVQGPPLCMSYHFTNNNLCSYKRDKRQAAKKAFFYDCCMSYGIIFAPPSRIYLNTAISERDLQFFEERIYEAFRETASILS